MPTLNKQKKRYTYKKHTNLLKIYNTAEWKKLRRSYLMQHPLCEVCLSKGIVRNAEEVHHIKPISTGIDELEQKDLLLNSNNLMALCKDCHHLIHKQMKI